MIFPEPQLPIVFQASGSVVASAKASHSFSVNAAAALNFNPAIPFEFSNLL
jgi:hypothetical protein